MANPVTVADLEARWRPLSAEETTVAQALLDDAWEVLSARTYLLQSRLDDASLSVDLVRAVVSAMVLRVLRNPDGKRQESIDDYSWTRDNAVASGLLYVTDEELALLAPAGVSSGAFSIQAYGEPGFASRPLNWWELNL